MSNARELAQSSNQAGRKNILYNGSFAVAQRGTSLTGITTSQYTLDRWFLATNNDETLTIEQSTDHPLNGGFSLKVTTTTADASVTGFTELHQRLEGFDVQKLLYGVSGAKKVTVSFWIKSSQTGNAAVTLYTADANFIIGSTVTIDSANQWEYKTVTFVGDTANSIPADNTEGLRLAIGLAAGATYNATDNTSWGAYANGKLLFGQTLNVVGTLNATFQLADFQLELGTVATEFENLSFGEELALCQRYYEFFASGTYPGAFQGKCSSVGGGGGSIYVPYKVTKRANGTVSSVTMRNANTGATASASAAFISTHGHAYGTGGVAGIIGDAMHINSIVTVDSEL